MAPLKVLVVLCVSALLCVEGRNLESLKSKVSDLLNKNRDDQVYKRTGCSDYVCNVDYTAAIDSLTSQISTLDAKVDSNYQETSTAIADLESNYNTNTVRKCQSGTYTYACDPYCGSQGQYWAAGVVKTITFASAFHTSPSIVLSLTRYDDYDNTDVRFQFYVSQRSTTQFKFTLKSASDSKMSRADIGWIACA